MGSLLRWTSAIGRRSVSGSTEANEGVPPLLQPWEHAGWFATVVDWIEATLPGTLRIDQFATWAVSTLHRVETAAGRYYFKAAPALFRHEAVVTEMLADRFPKTSRVRSRSTASAAGC